MKKKNKKKICLVASIIMLTIVLGYILLCRTRITTSEANLVFGKIDIILNQEESDTLKEILNNKLLFMENLYCGFSEDKSIKFGDLIFCIAHDSCNVIKVGKMYFNISEEEREIINQIFKNHGGRFPCI